MVMTPAETKRPRRGAVDLTQTRACCTRRGCSTRRGYRSCSIARVVSPCANAPAAACPAIALTEPAAAVASVAAAFAAALWNLKNSKTTHERSYNCFQRSTRIECDRRERGGKGRPYCYEGQSTA